MNIQIIEFIDIMSIGIYRIYDASIRDCIPTIYKFILFINVDIHDFDEFWEIYNRFLYRRSVSIPNTGFEINFTETNSVV